MLSRLAADPDPFSLEPTLSRGASPLACKLLIAFSRLMTTRAVPVGLIPRAA
jgi:hypothetical protein